jgi:hypothetical protein
MGAKMWAPCIFLLPRLDSVRFFADVPPPSSLSDLNRPELEALLVELFGEVAALKQTVNEHGAVSTGQHMIVIDPPVRILCEALEPRGRPDMVPYRHAAPASGAGCRWSVGR